MKRLLTCIAALLSAHDASASDHQFHRDTVAAVICGEARGEGEQGMRAVAEVIRNRKGDPFKVVTARWQFSVLNKCSPSRLIERMRQTPQWVFCVRLADALYACPERIGNVTRGANHYHERSIRPDWVNPNRFTVRIGNHLFFAL